MQGNGGYKQSSLCGSITVFSIITFCDAIQIHIRSYESFTKNYTLKYVDEKLIIITGKLTKDGDVLHHRRKKY